MRPIILNFHGLGPVIRNINEGERNCWLATDFFEAVLDIAQGQPHIQLTFDDGNASDASIALPILLRRGLTATFFVCSDRVDQPTFLHQSQVRKLIESGMEIGSHGATHCAWRHLSLARMNYEIAGSKKALEKLSHRLITRAACPFGSYDYNSLRYLKKAGYQHVYTSDGGSSNKRQWLQARTTVTRTTSLHDIQRLVHHGCGIYQQSLINARKFLKRFC